MYKYQKNNAHQKKLQFLNLHPLIYIVKTHKNTP